MSHRTGLEIAIVGLAGRFPGAADIDAFWANLRDGVESLVELSDEELLAAGADPGLIHLPNYVRKVRKLGGVDRFDAPFFGVSPREAELLDPQIRVLLECSWEALEDAGYDPATSGEEIGVFAGARLSEYLRRVYSRPDLVRAVGDLQVQLGSEKDFLATRISYKLGLGGPSVTVQTACSTALVAVHLASQALVAGECRLALAGAAAIFIPEELGYLYREGEPYSPDGHCRPFDARARGTVFGNAVGMVVLKRLDDALADGDRIRAVLRGSAVTNDGSRKAGFTAPGLDGQVRVVRAALAAADVPAETIRFLEAHGTATLLGDPIEITAATRAFRELTDRRQFCAVGSVKGNIGHSGAAAGVAGLIKTVLAFEHEEIPPSIRCEEPNPEIDFASSPFFVNTALLPWPAADAPRRAAVSSFGMGGTNAHVVVEEAPSPEPSGPARPWSVLTLSARTAPALEATASRLAEHLRRRLELPIADVAFTLAVGRKSWEHRRVVVCRDGEDAAQVLSGEEPRRAFTGRVSGDRQVAFLFSGQGSQYPGMAAAVYAAEPVFREEVDRCAEILAPRLGCDLRELLFADPEAPGAEERLAETALTQPALFTLEIALAHLWMTWGIRPAALAGHSVGEYAAACLAGVFSLPDALAVIAERGRLMQGLPPGAMLGVPLPEEEVTPLLGDELSLAAVNAPDRCVVAGPDPAVDELAARLAGVDCRRLHTTRAFHSRMMEPIRAAFREVLAGVELAPPRLPIASNLTGRWLRPEEATDPDFWVRQMLSPVRFADGVATLCSRGDRAAFLEVGPGNALASLARRHPSRSADQAVLASLPHPRERQDAEGFLLATLGRLWIAGVRPDWALFYAGERRRRVALPTYPFERRRYWIETSRRQPAAPPVAAGAAEVGRAADPSGWFYLPAWRPTPPPWWEPAAGGDGAFLVFADGADGAGVAAEAVRQLAAAGRPVALATPGDAFERRDAGGWTVRPGRRDDYVALLAALAGEGIRPAFVLHAAGLTGGAGESGETGRQVSLERTLQSGFRSLLALGQALGREARERPVRLVVAVDGAFGVAGEPVPFPEKAAALGPVRVLPQEHPGLDTRLVDIGAFPPGADAAEWLLGELAFDARERVVAYRSGRRLVQHFVPAPLGPPLPERLPVRAGGVYLVTGGLGGIGTTVARFLAREAAARGAPARLVLTGRSTLPPREGWEELLAARPESVEAQRVRAVRAVEEAGGEVLVLAADAADRGAMERALETAHDRFGAVHGAVHAAGLPGGGLVQLKDPAEADRVLAPKVAGGLLLNELLADDPLDFLVLCSSTIAVLGGIGQVDYCAANAVLDSLAQARQATGRPGYTVSVDWTSWREVGMAVAAGITAAAPVDTPVEHPLLDLSRRIDGRVEYLARLAAPDHWLLDEHRIRGVGALPGTAWVEMARAAFADHAGAAAVEIRDLLFVTPLLVEDGAAAEVAVVLTEADDGEIRFRAESRVGGVTREHARGRLRAVTGDAPAPVDPVAIASRLTAREVAVEGDLLAGDGDFVRWGPRWQSLRRVQVGEDEGLASLRLPEPYRDELAALTLHPALLDVATALASGLLADERYLPLAYQRIVIRAPLPAEVLSWIRRRPGAHDGRETVTVDVTLLDTAGRELVAIEGFTMKRVGSPGARPAEVAAGFRAAAAVAGIADGDAATGSAQEGISPDEGVDALARLLSRRPGPQVVVSDRDLEALAARAGDARRKLAAPPDEQEPPLAAHPRPEMATVFVAPRTPTEETLAAIWQEALGLEQVGVDDNFFDLGGDSVLGIRVISRLGEAGFDLFPEELFEHQTVAELAAVIDGGAAAGRQPAAVEAGAGAAAAAAEFPEADLSAEELARLFAEEG